MLTYVNSTLDMTGHRHSHKSAANYTDSFVHTQHTTLHLNGLRKRSTSSSEL